MELTFSGVTGIKQVITYIKQLRIVIRDERKIKPKEGKESDVGCWEEGDSTELNSGRVSLLGRWASRAPVITEGLTPGF